MIDDLLVNGTYKAQFSDPHPIPSLTLDPNEIAHTVVQFPNAYRGPRLRLSNPIPSVAPVVEPSRRRALARFSTAAARDRVATGRARVAAAVESVRSRIPQR